MTAVFEQYKQRIIAYNERVDVNDWSVKIYTISNRPKFESLRILSNIKKQLPVWLQEAEKSTLELYKKAFLIAHEAREGVWIILNWWTGGEMIQTKVLFADYHKPNVIKDSPYATSSLLCVWELEVFAHERKAWIRNVLEHAKNPSFESYLSDILHNE